MNEVDKVLQEVGGVHVASPQENIDTVLNEVGGVRVSQDLSVGQQAWHHAESFAHGTIQALQKLDYNGQWLANKLGFGSQESVDKAAATVKDWAGKMDPYFENLSRDMSGLGVSHFAGEIAPYFLAPGGLGIQATTKVGTAAAFLRAGVKAGEGIGIGGAVGFGSTRPGESHLNSTLLGAAFGGGTAAVLHIASVLRPSNLKALYLGLTTNKLDTEVAKTADRLATAHGQWFTLAEKTGDPWIASLEVAARGGSKGMEKGRALDIQRLNVALGTLRQDLGRFETNGLKGTMAVGTAIKGTYTKVVDGVRKMRAAEWDKSMEQAHQLSDGARFITSNELTSTLVKMQDDFASPLATSKTSQAAKKFVQTELAALKKVGRLSAREAQQKLKEYNAAAKGKMRLFGDDVAEQQIAAGDLARALKHDLDNLTEFTDPAYQTAAASVRAAREGWKKMSSDLDSLRMTVIGKMLDKGPNMKPAAVEDFVTAFTKSSAKPSEVRDALAILNDADPQIVQAIKHEYLTRVFDQATKPKGKAWGLQEGLPTIDPVKWLDALDTSNPVYRELFKAAERARHKDVVGHLRRLADTSLHSGQSFAEADMGNVVRNVTGFAVGGAQTAIFAAGFVAKFFSRQFLSSVLLDPRGSEALQAVVREGRITRMGYNKFSKYVPTAAFTEAMLEMLTHADPKDLPVDLPPSEDPTYEQLFKRAQ
jgi:hypothetical protein